MSLSLSLATSVTPSLPLPLPLKALRFAREKGTLWKLTSSYLKLFSAKKL